MVPQPNSRTRVLLALTRRGGDYFVFGVLRVARTPSAEARGSPAGTHNRYSSRLMTPASKQLSQTAGPDRRVGRVSPVMVSNPRRHAATTGAKSIDQWKALVCGNAVWLSMMSPSTP